MELITDYSHRRGSGTERPKVTITYDSIRQHTAAYDSIQEYTTHIINTDPTYDSKPSNFGCVLDDSR